MTTEKSKPGFWKGIGIGSAITLLCTVLTTFVVILPSISSSWKGLMRIAETPGRVDSVEDAIKKSSERMAILERNQQQQAQDMATGFARIENLMRGNKVGSPRQLENN